MSSTPKVYFKFFITCIIEMRANKKLHSTNVVDIESLFTFNFLYDVFVLRTCEQWNLAKVGNNNQKGDKNLQFFK